MGAIQFGFYNVLSFAVRGDGFFPKNGMLSTFAILFVVMQGIDWIREKKFVRGIIAVVVPLILPFIMYYLVFAPFVATENKIGLFLANLVSLSVLPLHSAIVDLVFGEIKKQEVYPRCHRVFVCCDHHVHKNGVGSTLSE